jgi:predicted dehydrogenase
VAKDIGVGVIGVGMGASVAMINEVAESRLEVRAFCAPRQERVDAVVAETGARFGTTDYRELVARDDIDVVAVFSPDHLHYEHCSAALEQGKHVLCTKPVVTSIDDARALVSLVERSGKVFVVGQTMRFEPPFATARRFFDDGDLGEITLAEAHYAHDMRPVFEATPWRLEAPQDFVYGGLCHPVDAMRWFLGDIARVQAFGRKGQVSSYPLPDNFVVNLEFESGVIGRVLGTFGVVHQPMSMMGIGLYGDRGSLIARFGDFRGGELEVVLDKVPGHRTARIEFEPEVEGAYGHGRTLIRMLQHLEDCILTGASPYPSVLDGARTIAVGSAIWRSVRSGGALCDVEPVT